MKKIIYGLVLCLSLLVGIKNVKADSSEYTQYQNDTMSKSAVLLCEYADPSDPNGHARHVKLYYHFESLNGGNSYKGPWANFFLNNGSYDAMWFWAKNISMGSFKDVFATERRISKEIDDQHFSASEENTFVCPNYASLHVQTNESFLCYSDYGKCSESTKAHGFTYDPELPLMDNSETLFAVINKYALSDGLWNSITFEVFDETDDFNALLSKKISEYTDNYYQFTSVYKKPPFVDNYISNIGKYVTGLENKYSTLMEKMRAEAKTRLDSGKMTQEEYDEFINKTNRSFASVLKIPKKELIVNDELSCDGLLGPDATKIVNNIFKCVQYAGPILVFALSILDFIKAVSSGNQDDLKKATNKFMKRVVAAVLLFFVPLLCEMLFSIAGVTVPETCIGK